MARALAPQLTRRPFGDEAVSRVPPIFGPQTGLELEQELEVIMDWSDCPLVEVKPGVQRGRPVLKGTRMPVDDIVENWEAGVDEPDIAANFRLPIAQVKTILSYAADNQHAPRLVR